MTLYKKVLFVLIIINSNLLFISAQYKLNFNIQSQYNFSSKSNLLPLYQYSNKWGIIDPFEQSQVLLLANTKYNLLTKKNIQINTGISGVLKDQKNDSFLHEAYINTNIYNIINICIGKQAFSPISYNDNLTTGGFMRNANARPIPRVQIGMFKYVPVKILNNAIEIKGGLSHGILNDNRTETGKYNSADNVQVHEKWFYVRLGGEKAIKPYLGLFHAALLGGKRSNGTKILIDYWATFLGSGSNKLGGGEATNAAGAHDGFWDFGINYINEKADIHFYIQKPYADKTGLMLYNLRNKDYKIGILANIKDSKLINKFSIELIKTDVQSGYGLPDPLYPNSNTIIWLRNDVKKYNNDYDVFMLNVFGEVTQGYDYYKTKTYLEQNYNHGHRYGERDDYNNNGTYYNAWTYDGLTMGLPLYHTQWQSKKYAQNWESNDYVVFSNNRIKGIHIGLEGELLNGLKYLLKSTYTQNLGTYGEEFVRRYSWKEDPNFYYKGGKNEIYTYLNLNYISKKWKYLTLNTSFAYDAGDLYHSFGWQIGVDIKL